MLFVMDIERMLAFYRDVMGFRAIAGSIAENWIQFDTGDCRFALHAIPAEYRCENPEFEPREASSLRLDFAVPDVDSERRRLEALGVRTLIRPWGACDAVDPEGNVVGLRAVR
jgi:catechol 2,3-dioxygenase-like lactoylglutathione lyase family enzyme